MFSDKISAANCSGKEIAGLKKKRKMMMMTEKLRMSEISRGELGAHIKYLGILCIARYWRLSPDNARFDPCHPYIASTDALIGMGT